jgi:hypothetical protein
MSTHSAKPEVQSPSLNYKKPELFYFIHKSNKIFRVIQTLLEEFPKLTRLHLCQKEYFCIRVKFLQADFNPLARIT